MWCGSSRRRMSRRSEEAQEPCGQAVVPPVTRNIYVATKVALAQQDGMSGRGRGSSAGTSFSDPEHCGSDAQSMKFRELGALLRIWRT